MFIDLHMHEMTYSKDSFLALEEIVKIAKEKGLDGICITDHDSMGLKAYAEQYTKQTGYPIFVGIEYYSLEGDIVAFGIDEYPRQRISAQEFIDEVNRKGGICFSAHPFRHNNRGLKELLADVSGLHGVEVLNGSTLPKDNLKASQYAVRFGLTTVGASDCHVPEKVGVYATYFPEKVRTLEEFVEVFKKGQLKPAVWEPGGYRIIDRDLEISRAVGSSL